MTVRILPAMLGLALLYGLIKLVAGARFGFKPLSGGWIPLLVIAAVGSIWGLRLGYSVHGRGEPLAVGVFGLLLMGAGLLLYPPLTLIGVFVLLAATIWSAKAQPRDTSDK